jgi:transposase-like protein
MEQNNTSDPGAGEVNATVCAADRWRAIIAEQRESGLGMAEFCRQRSIRPTTFYGWRQKLEGPDRRGRRRSVSPRPSAFVSVKLASAKAAGSSSVLEIRLRGGRAVLVRDRFERDLLIELVTTLETLA